MNNRNKIAFFMYLSNSIISIGVGIRYLFCKTIMPYHQQAIAVDWASLGSGVQILLNGLTKVVAGGFIVVGLTMLILLIGPFRSGQRFARWLIPLVGCTFSGFLLYVAVNVALNTSAASPWHVTLVSIVVFIAAYLISDAEIKSDRFVAYPKH